MSGFKSLSCLLLGNILLFGIGCNPGSGVEEKTIQVSADNDPLNEPRSILKRYAEGQSLGSEVEGFPDIVKRIEAIDPERAQILKDGFAEIQEASASERKALAAELLKKIQPSMQ